MTLNIFSEYLILDKISKEYKIVVKNLNAKYNARLVKFIQAKDYRYFQKL
jgi:hypothetical protein